jgi:transcriptional regulator with AAA-type ATPase domain
MEADSRAAYMLAAMHYARPEFWLETLSALLADLKALNAPGSADYESETDILNAHVTLLPADSFKVAENLRAALVELLESIVMLPNGYRDRFRAIQKLLELQADTRLVGRHACKALDSGIVFDRPEFTIIAGAFRTLTFADVDSVLSFIADMQKTYVTAGTEPVADFLTRLERELRLVGVRNVLGRSLRVQYVREVVAADLLDRKTNILVVGQTGASKTFMAERMVMNSKFKRLVVVNGAAGARKTRAQIEVGLSYATTEPTTLLIDEVYRLPTSVQEFCLVEFGDTTREMRVISTSSTPIERLRAMLKADFMGRIQGWTFTLRELSATPDDLDEVILEHARTLQIDIHASVVECLKRHTWPENHRELAAFMKQLAIVAKTQNSARVDVAFVRSSKGTLNAEMSRILAPLF